MNKRKLILEAIALIADIAMTVYTKRKQHKQDRREGRFFNAYF